MRGKDAVRLERRRARREELQLHASKKIGRGFRHSAAWRRVPIMIYLHMSGHLNTSGMI